MGLLNNDFFNEHAPAWVKKHGVPILRRLLFFALPIGASFTALLVAASYFYAAKYGARIPVEGIPFLNLSTLVFSIIFIILWTIGEQVIMRFSRIIWDKNFSRNAEFAIVSIVLFFVVLPLMVWAIVVIVRAEFSGTQVGFAPLVPIFLAMCALSFNYHSKWNQERIRTRKYQYMQRPDYLIRVIGVLMLLTLTFGQGFEEFLRFTKFGGGYSVTVVADNGKVYSNVGLFLRSHRTVTVWSSEDNKFLEFNRDDLVEITYSPNASWQLPPGRFWKNQESK